jgi:hypothetical protein
MTLTQLHMVMDWTVLLNKAGIPDAPGYQQLLQQLRQEKQQRQQAGIPAITKRAGSRRKTKRKP